MASALPGWGEFLNGGYQDAGTVGSKYGQQFLTALQKYDPNAQWVNSATYGGEGGGSGEAQYTLQYDPSKLPSQPQGMDMNAGAFAALHDDPNAGYRGHLFDNSALNNDSFWGTTTPRSNLNTAADDRNIVDIIGPLVVGAATMGGSLLGTAPGMLAGGFNAAGSGAFAAGGGAAYSGAGSQLVSSLVQKFPGLLQTGSNMFSNPTGPSAQQQSSGMSPQMLALLRYLQQNGQQTGG